MLMTAEFWVLVSFVVFLGIIGYVGVHKTILSALDARSKKIAEDLPETLPKVLRALQILAGSDGPGTVSAGSREAI